MSTKIYNGLMVKAKNIKELKELRDLLQKEIAPFAINLFYQYLIDDLVYLIDDRSIRKKEKLSELKEKPYEILCDEFKKNLEEIKKNKRSMMDFTINISIFPLKNKCLAYPFCDKAEIIEKLSKLDIFSEYSYYNNSDRPKEITSRQWKKREKDWDEACPKNRFSDGFNHEIISNDDLENIFYQFFRNKTISSFIIPSNEKRIKRIVENYSIHFYQKEKDNTFTINYNEIYSMLFSPEMISFRKELYEGMKNDSLEEITEKNFFTKIR